MMSLFRSAIRPASALALLLPVLAGCGDFPRPFQGAPGATAMRLAQPPPPRLAVPVPSDAMLTDAAARSYAAALAEDLRQNEVPAVAESVKRGDWVLTTAATQRAGTVVPLFTVNNPKGEPQGNAEGKPVPVAAWAAADPTMLQQSATDAAPAIARLLTQIQASLMHSDPNSLYNRAARVLVPPVTGAPGDGNASLTKQMHDKLGQLGPVVQDTAQGADFVVQGDVVTAPLPGNMTRVEIQWTVTDTAGKERGKVVQLNEVPAGTLNGYWGDIAATVAAEAAGGVKDVILTQSGRR